ncbi:hypothetical protein NMY22_g10804 [Coprinellus aureogranulatus]|nr:hypothetical protein NMY22_g10804 [Coprinellus aureogranulatus]
MYGQDESRVYERSRDPERYRPAQNLPIQWITYVLKKVERGQVAATGDRAIDSDCVSNIRYQIRLTLLKFFERVKDLDRDEMVSGSTMDYNEYASRFLGAAAKILEPDEGQDFSICADIVEILQRAGSTICGYQAALVFCHVIFAKARSMTPSLRQLVGALQKFDEEFEEGLTGHLPLHFPKVSWGYFLQKAKDLGMEDIEVNSRDSRFYTPSERSFDRNSYCVVNVVPPAPTGPFLARQGAGRVFPHYRLVKAAKWASWMTLTGLSVLRHNCLEPGSSASNPFSLALQAARARQVEQLAEEDDSDDGEGIAASLLGSIPAIPMPARSHGDFHINYDKETPLRAIDIGGPNQEQRIAEFVSKEIDNNTQGLDVANARKYLGLKDKKSILPGTEFRLLDHQAIGVAWMVKMETERKEKGGILADDMGLGKTVQMIALMAKNQPTPNDSDRSTLIVVPAALMQQWKDEIETKTNGLFEAHIHHGKDKLKKSSQVRKKDVVITSYQTLCLDFGTPNDVEPDEEAEWLAKNGGVLARTKFYRVIADEAQFIRNRSTRSSISMAYVRAKYRWMLTAHLFEPWNDWPSFNDHIAKVQVEDAPLAGQRAQVILKPLLLRRTKNSTLEGKPILELPVKEIELVKLKFSPEERDIYDSYESRAKIKLNKFIRERTLVKHHHFVLVMILRLRQLCCHPNLILGEDGNYEDVTATSGDDLVKEIGRARRILGRGGGCGGLRCMLP